MREKRGHLNLTLLPSSNMRISFTADDGCTERLAILSNSFDSSEVTIEEISADSSGRSFLLKLPGSQILYFWCSEKSKLLGMGLLGKMKDLLRRKPTLSHLTGIHESRLESFASHFREFFLGSSNSLDADPIASSVELLTSLDVHSPPLVFKSSCLLTASLDGNHYPRPNICKDGTTSSSSTMENGSKDKLRQHGDLNNLGSLINSHTTYLPLSAQTNEHCQDDSKLSPFTTQTELNCPLSSPLPLSISPFPSLPPPPISSLKSLFSPYNCWCPPCPSSLQYSTMASHLPTVPPLSSLLSLAQTPASLVTSSLPLDVPNFPALDLPPLLPESFARLPLPVSLIATLPTSQQISTFTPFMSDPIVHIPVIDVCSSGQGYLVSGGPAISSAIPPLIPKFVNHPLIQHTESAAEKSAREALRMLLASTPPSTCQKAMNILPPSAPVNLFTNVLTPPFLGKTDEKLPTAPGSDLGNQCLCSRDFEAVEMSSSSMGLSPSRALMNIGNHDSIEDFASGLKDCEGCDCKEHNLVDSFNQKLADNI